ncbi:hypothetical protein [Roseovarius aquimarinus]|uniref:Transposase n=1 Tax=Roseovarius aquimarinus TaxID=1229156 RepID=A0ABW7IB70_9RHOB
MLPSIDGFMASSAQSVFANARFEASRKRVSQATAARWFNHVASHIKPTAEKFCKAETKGRASFDSNVRLEIDHHANQRNTCFIYIKGKPIILMTMPILRAM